MRPTAITLNRKESYLGLVWDDGHESRYPLAGLREACPCVECRGGHENMGAPPNPDALLTLSLSPAKDYTITRLVPAGNYALQPEWGDGHHTGFYTWPYLRALCPCADCKTQRATATSQQETS